MADEAAAPAADESRYGWITRVWHSLRRWWQRRFSNVSSKEKWGYGVWGVFGLIVAVPELWAVADEESAKWPTISATIGELEFRWPEVALLVIAVIVSSVYSALRLPAEKTGVLPNLDGTTPGQPGDPALPNRTPEGRRLTRSTTPLREVNAGLYFGAALVIIIASTWFATWKTDETEEFTVGRTLYGTTALFWVALPSLLAWPKRWGLEVPFPTLFETLRSLERRLRPVVLVVASGLVILLIHLVLYPWPETIPDIKKLHDEYEQGAPGGRAPLPSEPPEPTAP